MTITKSGVTERRGRHLMGLEECLNLGENFIHAHKARCAKSHCQGVNLGTYRNLGAACDNAPMSEPDEVSRVKDALRRLMDRRGIKAKPLSKKAGLGETFVRDIFERDGSDLKIGNLHKLAGALDARIEDLVSGAGVTIVGRVGAGGSVIFDEAHNGLVPRPPGFGGELEALEVDGSSMLPRYSPGDVVYIARSHEGVDEQDIGDFCVVRVATGETYVKLLARGARPGFFTLRSLNAEDIEDVELEWATPIIFVLPRAARRRLGY